MCLCGVPSITPVELKDDFFCSYLCQDEFYDALEEMYDDSELNFNESELNEISL
jgi:hypothetical protein|tara:strand:- start:1391 stop:1552 length:162 start_codon:yes stop_codon:yes gene_type:complete